MERRRSLSPLKSPVLQHHLRDEIDIHYPEQFMGDHPKKYTEMLIGRDGYFRAAIDIHDFKADEIHVKTLGHTIIVKCAHDEKEDEFGNIERKFSRKYVLPLDLNIDKISTSVSQGVLYIKVPPKDKPVEQRIIDIKLEDH